MIRYILTAMLLLSPTAQAQEVEERIVAIQPSAPYQKSILRLTKTPQGADLVYINELTGEPCCDVFELKVGGVRVVVRVDTSGPPKGRELEGNKYPDVVTVTEVTDGYQAYPEQIIVDEQDSGMLQIIPGMS